MVSKRKGIKMKAVIYARYSSNNQTEQSIEGQLRVCNNYAQSHGITVVGTYIDRALSGRTDTVSYTHLGLERVKSVNKQ